MKMISIGSIQPGILGWRCARALLATVAMITTLLFASAPAKGQGEPPGCTGSGLGILLFTDAGDTHIGDTIRYSVTVLNGTGNGPTVCDASDIKAFVVTPDGISHPIALSRTRLRNGESDYYTNVVSYVVRRQDIQADGTVRCTAQDTGVIHQNETNSQGGANQGVNTGINQPCIQLAATCVGGVGENGLITFTGTVLNCGNNTLQGIRVSLAVDGVESDVTVISMLNPGQTAAIRGGWVPSNPCAPSSAALVATAIDGVLVPHTVTSRVTVTCSETLSPGIRVFKVCPVQPVRPGQLVEFSGSVSNTGNVTLTKIVVVNSRPAAGTPVFSMPSLAPGASAVFTGSYLAPTNCSVADTLNVTAASVCGVPVADSATATCPLLTTPQIVVTAACPTTPVQPGGALSYTGTVQNTGDVILNNVVVVSDRPGPNTTVFSAASLAPGATASFSSRVTAPAGACEVTTTFSASAKDACTGAAVASSDTATCTVVTAPAISVTLTCPSVTPTTGGPVVYSGTVRNSGNVALNAVAVRGDLAFPGPGVLDVPTLAPGASANFTVTFNAPPDACALTSVVTASGRDACTSGSVSATASATCALSTTPRLVVTQSCPSAAAALGGVLGYTGTVSNAGNVTLTNVVVTSDRTGSTIVFSAATLLPGAVESFSGSYSVPANTGCSVTSTLAASANNKCNGARLTAVAPATCPVQGTPSLAVTVACPVAPTPLGGVLAFTGTVRNTGNVTLTNVVVRREAPGPSVTVFTSATLAAGATATFSGTTKAPMEDTCALLTVVSAGANDNCGGVAVTANATVECPLVTAPRLVLVQVCPPAPASPGSVVKYSGSVSNAGNVTLTNIMVLSPLPVPNTVLLALASLAPGGAATFDNPITVALDACAVSSTVVARGQDRCNGMVVEQSVTTRCPTVVTPQIAVTQECPPVPALEGGPLVYSGSVRNAGNILLTNVFVYSSRPVANTRVIGPISLDPGAVTHFTGSYTAPLDVCSVSNVLTAIGREKCGGSSVTNTTVTTCPVMTVPRIEVALTCPAAPSMTGATVTYSGWVRNAGSVTLRGVTVVNTEASPSVVLSLASLAPGASVPFTATVVSAADTCALSSTVVATAGDACSSATVSATASATCALLTAPQLVVTQDCPVSPASLGAFLVYGGTVRNAGNITLTNVTVTSDRSGTTPVFSVATLAPGAVRSFSGSFSVPVSSGCSISSVLTGAGFDACTGTRVTANTLLNCPLATAPAIVVTQQCPSTTVEPGSLLAFTGTVVNTGNVTLTNIVVVSSRHTDNSVVFSLPTLAPGASANFSGSYQVALDCCVVSSTVRVTAMPLCPGPEVADSFTATCTVSGTPKITVAKVCPVAPVKPGDLMEFRGTVRNSGSVTLVEVKVVNNLMGATPVLGPISLAPGESVAYSGAYIMPGNFCGPDTVTASGLSACTFAVVSDAAIVPCEIITSPGLSVTKNCPIPMGVKGSLFTFTGTVRNTGDVTLRDVFVVNSKPAANTAVIGPLTLVPGEAIDFSGSYMAPVCCCETVDTLAARGVSACTAQIVTATSTAICPLESTPRLSITRACSGAPVEVGGTFRYTGTIHNGGDVVLTNVIVLSSTLAGAEPDRVLGPIELGVGETKTFSGSYPVSAGSDPSNDTVTVRGQEACQGRVISATADCDGPVVPTVRITGVTLDGRTVRVTWTSIPGAIYALESKPAWDADWAALDGTVTGTGSTITMTHGVESSRHRVYRVKVVQE